MFKFITNLVPKEDNRVKRFKVKSRFSGFLIVEKFAQFSVGKKWAEEKQEKAGLCTRLPWFTRSTYTVEFLLCNLFDLTLHSILFRSAISTDLNVVFLSFHVVFLVSSFRTQTRTPNHVVVQSDDSCSAKWWNVRQDPRRIARTWRRCRRQGYRRDPRMVGEATTSS